MKLIELLFSRDYNHLPEGKFIWLNSIVREHRTVLLLLLSLCVVAIFRMWHATYDIHRVALSCYADREIEFTAKIEIIENSDGIEMYVRRTEFELDTVFYYYYFMYRYHISLLSIDDPITIATHKYSTVVT